MKRITAVLLVMLISMVSFSAYADYPVSDRADFTLYVDGNQVTADSNGVPMVIKAVLLPTNYIVNLAPVRALCEALGANINWNNTTKTVTVYNQKSAVALQVGNELVSIGQKIESGEYGNTRTEQITVAPINVNGTVYIPIRVVAENLGAIVNWNGTNSRIDIFSEQEPPAV